MERRLAQVPHSQRRIERVFGMSCEPLVSQSLLPFSRTSFRLLAARKSNVRKYSSHICASRFRIPKRILPGKIVGVNGVTFQIAPLTSVKRRTARPKSRSMRTCQGRSCSSSFSIASGCRSGRSQRGSQRERRTKVRPTKPTSAVGSTTSSGPLSGAMPSQRGPIAISPATHRKESCGPTWNRSTGLRASTIRPARAKTLKLTRRRPRWTAVQAATMSTVARTTGGWASTSSM